MFSRAARKLFEGGCFRAQRESFLREDVFARSAEVCWVAEGGCFCAQRESLLREDVFARSAKAYESTRAKRNVAVMTIGKASSHKRELTSTHEARRLSK